MARLNMIAATLLSALLTFGPQPSQAKLEAAPQKASAQASADATHAKLRALRDRLLASWESRDLRALLRDVHPNIVVTWQNAELTVGHAGLQEFYESTMVGDDRLIENIESELQVDALSTIYGGDTAIAHGTIRDEVTLANPIVRAPFLPQGSRFILQSRFTATLVRNRQQGGAWQLAAYHVSSDMFDNIVTQAAVSSAASSRLLPASVGFVLCLLGLLFVQAIRRRRTSSTSST